MLERTLHTIPKHLTILPFSSFNNMQVTGKLFSALTSKLAETSECARVTKIATPRWPRLTRTKGLACSREAAVDLKKQISDGLAPPARSRVSCRQKTNQYFQTVLTLLFDNRGKYACTKGSAGRSHNQDDALPRSASPDRPVSGIEQRTARKILIDDSNRWNIVIIGK